MYDYDVLDEVDPALLCDFTIPFSVPGPVAPAQVKKTLNNPKPLQAALEKQLEKYDYPLPGSKEQWQSYVMTRYFDLSLDIDPKISKPALDSLARTNIVGLHQEVQEININTRNTVEIEAEVLALVQKLVNKKPSEEVIDADFEEVE